MQSNSAASHVNDENLISMGLQGDEEALRVLFTRYRRLLRDLAYRVLRNQEEAEDAVQSCLLLAYRNLSNVQCRHSFRSWLVRILINEALAIVRKKKSSPTIGQELPSSEEQGDWLERLPAAGPDPEQALAKRESLGALMAQLVRLPTSLRSPIMLCDIGEHTIEAASAVLGLAPNTVKTRLHRGRARLGLAMRGSRSQVHPPDVLIGV